jgi:multidrug efflux pump
VLVIIYRQPGANIIETVDRVKALLPELRPRSRRPSISMSRSTARPPSAPRCGGRAHAGHRGDPGDPGGVRVPAQRRATLIPSVAVPVSLIGTFGVMYLLGYSLDNLSLMALTIATGFVVDDAIVVLENISRHIEAGMPRMQAALLGAREVGFTVLSMSLSR